MKLLARQGALPKWYICMLKGIYHHHAISKWDAETFAEMKISVVQNKTKKKLNRTDEREKKEIIQYYFRKHFFFLQSILARNCGLYLLAQTEPIIVSMWAELFVYLVKHIVTQCRYVIIAVLTIAYIRPPSLLLYVVLFFVRLSGYIVNPHWSFLYLYLVSFVCLIAMCCAQFVNLVFLCSTNICFVCRLSFSLDRHIARTLFIAICQRKQL